jgi:hypothetical protein
VLGGELVAKLGIEKAFHIIQLNAFHRSIRFHHDRGQSHEHGREVVLGSALTVIIKTRIAVSRRLGGCSITSAYKVDDAANDKSNDGKPKFTG